jgi:threonine/homoserine/homoserine lactone efflux protein
LRRDRLPALATDELPMTLDLTIAFLGYAIVTSITPGPNNAMLLASGVAFGFGRSIPHIMGINLGFGAMVLAVGLGADALFAAVPRLFEVMRVVGTAYLLYLAWLIARSGPTDEKGIALREPMTFLGAAAFQWVNPKAWMIIAGAVTGYTLQEQRWQSVVVIAALYVLANLPCICTWAAFGVVLRRFLMRPAHIRSFNYAMALILGLSTYPSVAEIVRTLTR